MKRGIRVFKLDYLGLLLVISTVIGFLPLHASNGIDCFQLIKNKSGFHTQNMTVDTGVAETLMQSMGITDLKTAAVSYCNQCTLLCQDHGKVAILGLGLKIDIDFIAKGYDEKQLAKALKAPLVNEIEKGDCICIPEKYLAEDFPIQSWNKIINDFSSLIPDNLFHLLCSFVWFWAQQYHWLTGLDIIGVDSFQGSSLNEIVYSRELFIEAVTGDSFNLVDIVPAFCYPH